MSEAGSLKPTIHSVFESAVNYYERAPAAASDRSYALLAEEFKTGLALFETFFDECGKIAGPFAYRVLRVNIERYWTELQASYPITAYRVGMLVDDIDDLAPTYSFTRDLRRSA